MISSSIRWFADGILNVSANCLDRHLPTRADQPAIVWEPDDPAGALAPLTTANCMEERCRFANVLKGAGIKRGDRITIYMPMIPEAAAAMLACARIGAVHSVVFGGFSPESLGGPDRGLPRGRPSSSPPTRAVAGARRPLKANVDAALEKPPRRPHGSCRAARPERDVPMTPGRDRWLHEGAKGVLTICPPEPVGAEDPLFLLYTSGSTGKPKGVIHSRGGYLLWARVTPGRASTTGPQVFWCAADVGWVTGHTYIVYGPLANGATTLMFEGVPDWPTPTASGSGRSGTGPRLVHRADRVARADARGGRPLSPPRASRRCGCSGRVGEPINPEAWRWYHDVVGDRGAARSSICGGRPKPAAGMISAASGRDGRKSPAARPSRCFGVEPQIVDERRPGAGTARARAMSW